MPTVQLVEKVCFIKKVLVLNPYPQTPFPRKGAILLGLPPLVPVGGFAPATPFSKNIGFSTDCSVIYITFFLSSSISAFSSEIGSFSSPEIILAISLFLPSKSSFVMPV